MILVKAGCIDFIVVLVMTILSSQFSLSVSIYSTCCVIPHVTRSMSLIIIIIMVAFLWTTMLRISFVPLSFKSKWLSCATSKYLYVCVPENSQSNGSIWYIWLHVININNIPYKCVHTHSKGFVYVIHKCTFYKNTHTRRWLFWSFILLTTELCPSFL